MTHQQYQHTLRYIAKWKNHSRDVEATIKRNQTLQAEGNTPEPNEWEIVPLTTQGVYQASNSSKPMYQGQDEYLTVDIFLKGKPELRKFVRSLRASLPDQAREGCSEKTWASFEELVEVCCHGQSHLVKSARDIRAEKAAILADLQDSVGLMGQKEGQNY